MHDHKKTFETDTIGRLLFKMSVPATVGMIANALYNLVDTIFVGRGVGSLGIGGLTIALPIQALIGALGLTFGTELRQLSQGDWEKRGPMKRPEQLFRLLCWSLWQAVSFLF